MQVSGPQSAASIPLQGRQAPQVGSTAPPDQAAPSDNRAIHGHAHDRDADTVHLSPQAHAAANKPHQNTPDTPEDNPPTKGAPTQSDQETKTRSAGDEPTATGEALTKEEEQELKDRDRETRTHEQAHQNAAGPFAQGGPVFGFQQGPDGRRYAVGGHVNIDTSTVPGDPQAAIQKMQIVRRAALAPAIPPSKTARSPPRRHRPSRKPAPSYEMKTTLLMIVTHPRAVPQVPPVLPLTPMAKVCC